MDELVTFIIVSSPSPCHPSTELLDRVISSLSFFEEVETPNILVVLDGYQTTDHDRTKKGRVSQGLAERYEEYCIEVRRLATRRGASCSVLRCDEHLGFAMAVKSGLEFCKTPFAMIIQQDRVFMRKISFLSGLIETMQQNSSIRYIGFPTSASKTHAEQLIKRYNLRPLAIPESQIPIVGVSDILLQPLIFWYDSNHLCHVKRYLQIYAPFKNIPPIIRDRIGLVGIKEMLLRKGDFIEDRFGQFQRNLMIALGEESICAASSEVDVCTATAACHIQNMFSWFGSYLVWEPSISESPSVATVYVGHLRGRHYDPIKAANWRQSSEDRDNAQNELDVPHADYGAHTEMDFGSDSV